jgi:hypothetical protein
MSHLANSFPIRNDDESELHPSQLTKKPMKLMLFFIIPSAFDEGITPVNPEDQRPECLPKFAAVRVPKGVPVARLRNLIRHVEDELHSIYGRAKRCNLVMVCDDDSNNWQFSFDLPTSGVVYV